MEKEHKIISLFSGAGGMDIGFGMAGFDIAVAVELDSACCDTLRTNSPSRPIINKDIRKVSGEEILRAAGLEKGEAALVIGGPPCQSWSLAGQRKGLEDDRGRLLFEFVRIVRETLPLGFVLENVKGLANWDEGKAMEMLINALKEPVLWNGTEYKYEVSRPKVLNAADFGVPQIRERLIIVGNRMGKAYHYPVPKNKPRKTVWEAIGALPAPAPPSETAVRVSATIKKRREKYGQ